MKQYSKNNVFYKIINKELGSNIILEGDHYIVINDISPKAPVHILVIPKGNYVDYCDFVENASDEEIIDFQKGIAKAINMLRLEEGGYKVISNSGKFGAQEIAHMHVHVLGNVSDNL